MAKLTVPQLLEQVRTHRQLSQTESAEFYGKTLQTYRNWVDQRVKTPDNVLRDNILYFKQNISSTLEVEDVLFVQTKE